MSWHDALREYTEFLKEKHQLTGRDIKEELFGEKIPSDAYACDLTPLQTAAKYLSEHLGKHTEEIAELLGRTAAEVQRLLTAAQNHPPLVTTGVPLPATLFADRTLSAAEHLVHALQQRGRSVQEIATLLNKHERTIWTLHYRAQEKLGGKQ